MKKNSILNKRFKSLEECLVIRASREFIVEKLLHIPDQMSAALLFGECGDKISVGGVEVGDENAFVELPEMRSYHCRRPMFVNVEKRDLLVRENPEPVPLPAGLIDMNAMCFGESFLQGFIQGSSLPADLVVEADDCARGDAQAAEVPEDARDIIVGDLDFISEKSRLGSGIRTDEGIRDFISAPAMDNLFADDAPVMRVDKASCLQPAAFDILLYMLRDMTARGKAFVSAMRTFFNTDINVLVNAVRPFPEVSGMTERRSSLLGVFRNFFHFIFLEGRLQRPRQILLNIFFFHLKFRILFTKFYDLLCSKIDRAFKFVNPCPEIIPFGEDSLGRFAAKEHAELLEGAVRSMSGNRGEMAIFFADETHSSNEPSFISSTFNFVTFSTRAL
jgi:hypothetical protein